MPATQKTSWRTPSAQLPPRGAVFLGAIAAIAMLWLGLRLIMPDPGAPDRVAGLASIEVGLEELGTAAGLDRRAGVVPITPQSAWGGIDILYVGTPECGYCADFVTGARAGDAPGLRALTRYAADRGLGLAYRPAVLGVHGIGFAALETCKSATQAVGADGLATSYAAFDDFVRAMSSGTSHRDALDAAARSLGVDPGCMRNRLEASRDVAEALDEVFPGTGVPRFYVEHPAGVSVLVGAQDIAARVDRLRSQ